MDGTQSCQFTIHFPVTMRTHPTAIETSGTAGDYRLSATPTVACSSVPGHYMASKYSACGNFMASSGTNFDSKGAGQCRSVNANAYLAWNADF